jgi:myosin heavy subunit
MKELERIKAENERKAIESLNSEQQVIIQEMEIYNQHNETLQKYLEQLRSQLSFYRNFSNGTSKHVQELKKQLKDLHNENIRLSNQICNTTTSRSDTITKSTTTTDVKHKTSLSKTSTSTLHLPSLNLNLLNKEEVSAFNDCTTELNSLRTQLKRVRNMSQELISTQTASTMECKELEEFFESVCETIIKVRPPALPIQHRSQSCRRYKTKQSILPSWDMFKSWPVSKVIENLNGSPSIMIRLHEEVFPNNLLSRRCIDFRQEVLAGSESDYIRNIRSRTGRRDMRSISPFSWKEII